MAWRSAILCCSYPIKTLLWRVSDLKPHVRAGLEADLRNRWLAFAPNALVDADSGPDNISPSPSLMAPAAPSLSRPESKAFHREDIFDRFLGWLAALLGR